MESKASNLVVAFVFIIILWHLVATFLQIDILPPPYNVFKAFLGNITSELGRHFIYSLKRVIISVMLAVGIAAPLGILIGQHSFLNHLFSPFIYIIYPVPKVVFVPIIILFFGIGDLSKILMIFIILFFQILVLTRDSAINLRPEVLISVKSLGAKRKDLFLHVFLPSSLPAIFTGIRQSIGTAIAVLYVSELFGTQYGLGYYIYITGSTLFDYPSMYAGILAMGILGFGLYFITDLLERITCPWKSK